MGSQNDGLNKNLGTFSPDLDVHRSGIVESPWFGNETLDFDKSFKIILAVFGGLWNRRRELSFCLGNDAEEEKLSQTMGRLVVWYKLANSLTIILNYAKLQLRVR